MEQDNERDYLGRQYGPGSTGSTGGEVPAAPTAEKNPNSAETDPQGRGTPAAPAAGTTDSPADVPARELRVGTIVWGLVLTALAVLLLLMNTAGLSVDPVLLVLCITLGAGLALLAGGFLSGRSRSR